MKEQNTPLNSNFKNESIGDYMSVYSTKSKLNEVLNVAQDGGFVTSLLIYLIESKLIDGAAIITVDEEWRPTPVIATNKDDVLKGAGTSYVLGSSLKALHDAVVERGLKRLAVVGTPCHINAARKLQSHSNKNGLGSAIYLTIGLFCTESFDYNDLRQHLERSGVDIRSVKRFNIKKGRFLVRGRDGKILMDAPIKELKPLARKVCHYCKDFTAECADISVGSVGSPDGWSTVIIRSDKGSRVFKELAEEGYIEFMPIERSQPGISSVIKLSQKKKELAKAS